MDQNWTEESRNYLPIRTEAELIAAAADGVRRWKMASRDLKNARTSEERDAADAAIRQIMQDEDSGLIPFVGIEDSLPPYVPLPTALGEVVATMVPRKKTKR